MSLSELLGNRSLSELRNTVQANHKMLSTVNNQTRKYVAASVGPSITYGGPRV